MKKYIKPEMDVMNIECGPVLLEASNGIPVSGEGQIPDGGIKARPQFDVWGADPVEE